MTYNYRVEVTRLAEDVATGDWCEEIGITTDHKRDWDTISDRVLRFARRTGWVTDGEPEVHVVRVYENGLLIENHATDAAFTDDEFDYEDDISDVIDSLDIGHSRELTYDW